MRVRIKNLGVPPGGCQVEFGVSVDGSVISVTQGWPTGNTRQRAAEEAKKLGLDHYLDENGKRVELAETNTTIGES